MGGSILVLVVRGRGPGAGRGQRRHLIARIATSLRFAFVLIFIFIAGVRGFHYKGLYAHKFLFQVEGGNRAQSGHLRDAVLVDDAFHPVR